MSDWCHRHPNADLLKVAIFNSLTETTKLQNSSVLDLFQAFLTGDATKAQEVLFGNSF